MKPAHSLVPLLLLLSAALVSASPPDSDLPSADVALNPFVREVMAEYPIDGSFGYHWPREGSWEGSTQALSWGGEALTSGDPQNRSYCCGLTFEIYVRALERAAGGQDVPGVDRDRLHELRLRFFGDSEEGERRRLCQFGLESMGLGHAVTKLEDARAGDFVQFWRHSGSGHQVIFVNWVWRRGEIVGITYWSSQTSTRGIGYHTESINDEDVKRDEIYVGRASLPETD
ncbi:hypothetical protein OAX78_03065 [Planctomycetota bacterium]|nr:hypothetical protein [Planctomycetota bacterium]